MFNYTFLLTKNLVGYRISSIRTPGGVYITKGSGLSMRCFVMVHGFRISFIVLRAAPTRAGICVICQVLYKNIL